MPRRLVLHRLNMECTISSLAEAIDSEPWETLVSKQPVETHVLNGKNAIIFEVFDRSWADFFTAVSVKTTIDRAPRTLDDKESQNIYGLLGEKATKDKLASMRITPWYVERDPHHFERYGLVPFDFAIPTREGGRLTIDVKTTRPYYRYVVIPEETVAEHLKRVDYTLGVKVLSFDRVEDTKAVGYGYFAGYATSEDVERLPVLHGTVPCTEFPGRAILLSELRPPEELWNLLNDKALKVDDVRRR